ncbi:universal stress protein [Sporichthya brevicatena]|uniref:Universal stress protein n=1 Tax=Sporichthya brevicatena TaxID=171442 RepID=A0ABP3SAI1_9ACTN
MQSYAGRAERGRIVVGTDGSPASLVAVRWAVEAAEQTGAWLDVVLVRLPGGETSALADHVLLADLVALVREPFPEMVRTFVIEGDPAACLTAHAHGADVLVLADRGAGGFLGLRLGSVASACTVAATCPVLIVPADRRRFPDAELPDAAPAAAVAFGEEY